MKMKIIWIFFFASLTASASIDNRMITPWTVYQPTYPETEDVPWDGQMSDSPPTATKNAKSVLPDETRSILRATSEYAKKMEALAKYVVEKGDTSVHNQKVILNLNILHKQ